MQLFGPSARLLRGGQIQGRATAHNTPPDAQNLALFRFCDSPRNLPHLAGKRGGFDLLAWPAPDLLGWVSGSWHLGSVCDRLACSASLLGSAGSHHHHRHSFTGRILPLLHVLARLRVIYLYPYMRIYIIIYKGGKVTREPMKALLKI